MMIYLSKKVSKEYKDGRQLNAVLTLGAVEKPFHLLTPRSNVLNSLYVMNARTSLTTSFMPLNRSKNVDSFGLCPFGVGLPRSLTFDSLLKAYLLALNKGLVTASSKKRSKNRVNSAASN